MEYPTDEYPDTVTMPKLIMQTWKDTNIPDKWKMSPQSIHQHMPGWNYVLMTDEDNRKFIQTYFPDFLTYYDRMEYPIQRADSIRYCWLYVNGGIYLDLDYQMLAPLDSIFYQNTGLYLATSSNITSSLTNSFMASKPGHQFWLEVIEEIKNELDNPTWWAQGKHLRVMMSTGPGMINRVASRARYPYTILPPNLLSPDNICGSTRRVGRLKSLEGCSWGSWDSRIYNWCFCHPVWSVIILVLLVLLVWYIIRTGWRSSTLSN